MTRTIQINEHHHQPSLDNNKDNGHIWVKTLPSVIDEASLLNGNLLEIVDVLLKGLCGLFAGDSHLWFDGLGMCWPKTFCSFTDRFITALEENEVGIGGFSM